MLLKHTFKENPGITIFSKFINNFNLGTQTYVVIVGIVPEMTHIEKIFVFKDFFNDY